MIKIQEIKLNEILPSILKGDKTVAAIAKVLQKYLDENYEYIKRLNILANIDNITNEDLIDHLAYQFHVDFYGQYTGIEKKKQLVKSSIYHHRKKGTKWATEDLLSKVFDSSYIKEWFQYDGDPYFFKIYTRDILGSEEKYKDVIKALNTVKNTRSWLEKLIVETGLDHNIYYAVTNRQFKIATYYPNSLEDIQAVNSLNVGIASRKSKSSNYTINTIEDIDLINPIFYTGICRRYKEIKMEVEHV